MIRHIFTRNFNFFDLLYNGYIALLCCEAQTVLPFLLIPIFAYISFLAEEKFAREANHE